MDVPEPVKFISEVPSVSTAIVSEASIKAMMKALRGDIQRHMTTIAGHVGFSLTNSAEYEKILRWDVQLHPTAEGLVIEVFPLTEQSEFTQRSLWNSLCTHAIADMKVQK